MVSLLNFNSYFPPTFDEKYARRKTKTQVVKEFDFIGLILLVGGLLIFLMGISWGGSYYPWKSAHVIATIVVGFFALVAFVIYESLVPLQEPLIPMYLFKNIPWVATMMVNNDFLATILEASCYHCLRRIATLACSLSARLFSFVNKDCALIAHVGSISGSKRILRLCYCLADK